MSVLIRGMEMPEYGKIMVVYPGGYTKIYMRSDMSEVPTPHGRLIDADDAVIDADERGFDFWCCDADIDSAQSFIREQPTVIEAEGE